MGEIKSKKTNERATDGKREMVKETEIAADRVDRS